MRIVALLLMAIMTACSGSTERSSAVVTRTAGAWRRAYVTVYAHPSFSKNGRDHPAGVSHTLFIEHADGNRLGVILGQWSEARTDHALFERLREMRHSLVFAPDGHAIAVSDDAGRHFMIFDLTAAAAPLTMPFYCPHRRVTTLTPWPDTRAVVLEVLDEASGHASTHRHDEADPTRAPFVTNREELLDASLYACAFEANDARLRRALVDAFVSPWHGAASNRGGDGGTLGACLGRISRRDPAVHAELVAARSSCAQEDAFRIEGGIYTAQTPER
jgi:hypothetical protein